MIAPLQLPAMDEIRSHEAEMIALRHRFHANPELAYEETATADLVAGSLQRWGDEVHRGLGLTGVVGTLKVGTSTRRIGLRADMDALPIKEASGKPWASQVLGKRQACGHDGHTAMLLSAALQTIMSRNVPPLQMGIVTVGALLAGDAPNVIPGEAELRLTVRAFKPEVRDLLQTRITEIAQTQAAVFGTQAEVNYQRRYPMLYNHPAESAFCEQVVRDWLGDEGLVADEPVTGSKDFAFFLEKVPGCYVFIGNGVGDNGGCMVHNPGYDFNDACLSTGASYWVKLAQDYLAPAA